MGVILLETKVKQFVVRTRWYDVSDASVYRSIILVDGKKYNDIRSSFLLDTSYRCCAVENHLGIVRLLMSRE